MCVCVEELVFNEVCIICFVWHEGDDSLPITIFDLYKLQLSVLGRKSDEDFSPRDRNLFKFSIPGKETAKVLSP